MKDNIKAVLCVLAVVFGLVMFVYSSVAYYTWPCDKYKHSIFKYGYAPARCISETK